MGKKNIIEDDIKRAKNILNRIEKETGIAKLNREVIFTLCLIYVRQLKHHEYEESQFE